MQQEDDVLPQATEVPFLRRATQQTVLVINLASQQKTAKLYFNFFSGKEKIQASIWFHLSHYAVVCEVINL